MSLTNLTTKTPYAGNGVTTVFPFTFKIFDQAHLVVTETNALGVTSTLVLNTDYTVTGVGLDAGGSITRLGATSPPPTGTTGLIRRVLPLTQTADIRNQSAFYAATHEDVFDKAAMVDQQQEEEIGRCVQLPEAFSSGVSTQLPKPSPGAAIGWDSLGQNLLNLIVSGAPIGLPGGAASLDANSRLPSAQLSLAADKNWGTNETTTINLTYGYYGGAGWNGTTYVSVANGTVALTANQTNYVQRTLAGVVSVSTSGWTAGLIPMCVATTNASAIITLIDQRVSAESAAILVQFLQAGTGAVLSTVDAKLKQIINAADFGVKADGATDDTAAMQAALNAMTATTTGSLNSAVGNYILNLPKGTILLSATVAGANSLSQFEMVGHGKRATVFKWTGAASIPVFKFTNCREAVFRDFGVVGNASTPPSYCIQLNRQLSGQVGSGAPTACQFHNIWCGGDSANMATTGIGYTCTAIGDDSNNDLGLFVGCEFDNLSSYGVSFEHGNSLLHRLISCGFLNCGVAAVNAVHVNGTFDSSFDAYDCGSSGCGATWRLGGSTHSVSIFGWKGEADTNVLVMPATAGATYPANLTLSGCSWVGGSGSAALTFDAGVGSTLEICGGKWTSPTALTLSFPTTGSRVKIQDTYFNFTSLAYNNEVDMQNNYVAASTPTLTNSGSGILRMVRSDGSGRVDTLPSITSGTSFSASGLSNSLVILNYASGTTLSSITNGYPGQILTLRAVNANATIGYGTGADNLRIIGGSNFTLMGLQQITLQKQDAANGNTWVEVSRSSPNQIYDATSGAFLYSGRIAASGTLSQWGPLNGTTTSATFGAGAVASNLGSFLETLSTGVMNFRVGTTGILAASFDATGNFKPLFYTGSAIGGAVASAATISPTGPIFHVTGTTTINTINLPYTGFTGEITIIPDGLWATGTSGNIALASTAVVSKALTMAYDGTKWYPSY